jgi:hypothetical protein
MGALSKNQGIVSKESRKQGIFSQESRDHQQRIKE